MLSFRFKLIALLCLIGEFQVHALASSNQPKQVVNSVGEGPQFGDYYYGESSTLGGCGGGYYASAQNLFSGNSKRTDTPEMKNGPNESVDSQNPKLMPTPPSAFVPKRK